LLASTYLLASDALQVTYQGAPRSSLDMYVPILYICTLLDLPCKGFRGSCSIVADAILPQPTPLAASSPPNRIGRAAHPRTQGRRKETFNCTRAAQLHATPPNTHASHPTQRNAQIRPLTLSQQHGTLKTQRLRISFRICNARQKPAALNGRYFNFFAFGIRKRARGGCGRFRRGSSWNFLGGYG
jgi:hypothetical protein